MASLRTSSGSVLLPDTSSTEYHRLETFSNSHKEDDASPFLDSHSTRDRSYKRPLLKTCLLQFLALLWLVPIIALLYLNFKNHVIGASAWCPGGKCWVDMFNYDTSITQHNLDRLDKENHNLLGTLQLVSKALEVWFSLIAASLVYIVTMMLAAKPDGLPIGYLNRPREFSELTGLFDPVLWTSSPPITGGLVRGTHKARIYLFIAMTVMLCIIANLMGPATAVLVLPSLQWIETDLIGNQHFEQYNSATPPGNGSIPKSWAWPCRESRLTSQNYSCAADVTGPALDAWIDGYVASRSAVQALSQQDYVSFAVNWTFQASSDPHKNDSNFVFWAPSRQVMADLSDDLLTMYNISRGVNKSSLAHPSEFETYATYNNSLQVRLQRSGPVIGTIPMMWTGRRQDATVTIVEPGREIRCYSSYNLYNTPLVEGTAFGNYRRCIRTGTGWDRANNRASFSVAGGYYADTKTFAPGVNVSVFYSDRAAFLPNGSLPDGFSGKCLTNGSIPQDITCDYDQFFKLDPLSPVANRSSHVNTVEMTIENDQNSALLVIDFVAFSAFANYTLDVSPLTNPLSLVQIQNLPNNGTPMVLDPAWTLAAWSADVNGVLVSDRTTTLMLLDVMGKLLEDPQKELKDDAFVDYLSLLPVIQTLSLIDHSVKNVSSTSAPDTRYPRMTRNARLNVWAYGLSSRTSYLGIVVAIAGCLVVLIQVVLGLVDRRPHKSSTELLIAALKHPPGGEFTNVPRNEKEMARVRFHLKHDDGPRLLEFHVKR
ncbi:hypothetical protein LTR50_007010 [Elasticomyces elasticus]|nr:hypothetical protein LTR50_007010 [Elasticomyces elasticus]